VEADQRILIIVRSAQVHIAVRATNETAGQLSNSQAWTANDVAGRGSDHDCSRLSAWLNYFAPEVNCTKLSRKAWAAIPEICPNPHSGRVHFERFF